MNTVTIVGKLIRKKETGKVSYLTIASRTSRETEFISVTTFQTEFISKYFPVGKWIGISGHIHINKINDDYITEIISDNIFFVGDKSELSFDNMEKADTRDEFDFFQS